MQSLHPMISQARSSLKMDEQQHQLQLLCQRPPEVPDPNETNPNLADLDQRHHQQQQQQQQQPVLSVLNPVAQQQQNETSMGHHLHSLQAPVTQTTSAGGDLLQLGEDQQSVELSPVDQQQQQSNDGSTTASNQKRPYHRSIEGIVAEGGGPIVQWLIDNYEMTDGESIPRSHVYNHYLSHCRQMRMSTINAASFGKLIRSVFVGLKTRRLGTRGHSKYHYFGVRAKEHVDYEWIQREFEGTEHEQHHNHHNHSHGHHHHLHQQQQHQLHQQPDTRMADNGSESDSMECGSSAGSSTKRLKRHMFSAASQQQQQAQRSDSATNANTMMRQQQQHHYDSADAAAAAQQQQQQSSIGCHHQSGPICLVDEEPIYSDGYGASSYYASSIGAGGGVGQYEASPHQQQQQQHHHHQHQQQQPETADHHLSGGTIWSDTAAAAATTTTTGGACEETLNHSAEDLAHFRNYLGQNNATTLLDDHWLAQEQQDKTSCLTTELTEQYKIFQRNYREYYRRLLAFLGQLDFSSLEHCLSNFWLGSTNLNKQETNNIEHFEPNHTWRQTNTSEQIQQQQNGNNNNDSNANASNSNNNNNQNNNSNACLELTTEQLKQLTGVPEIVDCIIRIDQRMFSAIVTFLMPNLLNPIPKQLAQQLRAFARYFPNWLENCLKEYPSQFQFESSKCVRDFSQALRRSVSINYLASASRAIWSRRSALAQMSADLGRVDLRDIEHQVSLMVQRQQQQQQNQLSGHNEQQQQILSDQTMSIDYGNQTTARQHPGTNTENFITLMVEHQVIESQNNTSTRIVTTHEHHQNELLRPTELVQSFLNLLNDCDPTSSWPQWCQHLVDSHVNGQSLDEARNFVLRWNYYVSLIMKELTLKSAPSLGSFQLIRLLFDEYIYYLTFSKMSHDHNQENKQAGQLLRSSSRFVENV